MTKMNHSERSWVLYDVGNSAFVLIASTIIPIYFKNLTAEGGMADYLSTAWWSYATAICTLLMALLGPVLGALADTRGYKKPVFAAFVAVGVVSCLVMPLQVSWMAFLVLFVLGKLGFNGSLVFYDSMLTDVTTDARSDLLSAQGYAWGYLGSCVPFVAALAVVLTAGRTGLSTRTAMTLAHLITAGWWLAFTLPLLRSYRQVYGAAPGQNAVRESLRRLGGTFGKVRRNRAVWLFLLAFFFYIDGVYTIIDMATSYGKDVGIGDSDLVLALLFTQIVAFPFALGFGRLAARFRAENIIAVCCVGYFGIVLFALQLDKAWEFWAMAGAVAMFQGAVQSMSRSYYARIIPKEQASEYFGFYDVFGKGASLFGALLMGISTQLFQSSKAGVAALALLFPLGLLFLRAAVREAQNSTEP